MSVTQDRKIVLEALIPARRGGGGGDPWEFLGGGGCPFLQTLTLFQTKKCHFSRPFSDLAFTLSLLRLEQQETRNLHIPLSFLYRLELKQQIQHVCHTFP